MALDLGKLETVLRSLANGPTDVVHQLIDDLFHGEGGEEESA